MKTQEDIHLELRKFVAPEYIFGINARKMAANYCKKLGAEKVFIATDSGLKKTPWYIELEDSLQQEGLEYFSFDNISPNPRDYEVTEGSQKYIDNKCNIIVAIGGGSVMDCAKGIGIIVSNQRIISNYEGIDKIQKPTPPLICIPTTAGTSADVSQFAIINNTVDKYKMAIISKALVPDVALIDPFVLQTMDNYLTACTGMDALCHAFEAFVSNANSAFTDLYALEAIRLLNENLLSNIQTPENIQARGKTMLGSLYAGLAFSNASLGCVHSMAHSLGGYLDLAHGECNAILLPHVVNFNFIFAPDRYTKIAEVLDLPISGLTQNQIRKQLFDYLINLKTSLNIHHSLRNRGVSSDIVPALAKKAIKDPCNATNPKAPHVRDLEFIYNEAL
ncbi:MAG: alcohol dehydrogenase-like regulatory protein ErcA [Bacteroidales bacterium]